MGNSLTCDACSATLEGVVRVDDGRGGWTEHPSAVQVWSDLGDPGTDFCVDCVRRAPRFKTPAHALMTVYERCGATNAARARELAG